MSDTEKVIAIIDVETTGLNSSSDQIIEFAVQRGFEAEAFRKSWRFKPTIPIPAGSTAIHGITDEDVAACPLFSSAISTVRKIIDGSDVIVGYNLKFDLEMLQGEFKRAGEKPLELSTKCLIDPHRLWARCEPRSLTDAVTRFVGKAHETAHSAGGDVQATGEVLLGMMASFGHKDKSWEDLADFINPNRKAQIGDSHHIIWKDGVPVFTFGKKHSGKPVFETVKNDAGYGDWVLGKDFPEHVKTIISYAQKLEREEFITRIKAEFGEG